MIPAAVFLKDNRVLLVDKTEMVSGLKGWEIPGGRANFGMTFEEALKDKIKNYFDVEISIKEVLPLVHMNMSVDKTMQFWVVPALCELQSENFKLSSKIKETRWFSKTEIDELDRKGQLVPGDKKILDYVFNRS
jgi:ADP-ribose pyrophosphatase YjhB (NUDIX family)